MAGIEYRFELDKQGVNEVANSHELRAEMKRRAENAAQWVRANAPRDSGAYHDSIHVVDAGRGGPRGDRAEIQLRADADDALWVEYGAYGREGHHLLFRAGDFIRRDG